MNHKINHRQACEILGVCDETLSGLVKQGKIKQRRTITNRRLYSETEVKKLLKNLTEKSKQTL